MNAPITVTLSGNRSYPVVVGSGVLAETPRYAAQQSVVISNPTVASLYGDTLLAQLKDAGKTAFLLTIPDGESYKNLHTLEQLLDEMFAKQLGRDGSVIALGGGVIGDVAGFAAAIYMRGIALLQVPTTLLAQVDAAIGGKTGINHARGKNLIGAFHQPRAVIADTAVLASLPAREYHAGLAEVVKYGLLGDADFFNDIEKNHKAIVARQPAVIEMLIRRSAAAKAAIVAADETEQSGRRALLNLGHTFAHALESVCGYGSWLHGEAVACGLVAAAKLSESVCGFAAADTARIADLLSALQLPVRLPDTARPDDLLAAMMLDKKVSGGSKRFILMQKIGAAAAGEADDSTVKTVLEELQ